MNNGTTNTLVVYFSHKGQNYSNGKIIDLEKGNTAVAAEMVAGFSGGELFEIRAKKEYPFLYGMCTESAQQELRANSRPELIETVDIGGYNTVILGYPNWWGTMPMPVWTFLEGHSFAGKRILPLCTHEGSGMGNSERDLKMLCPNADIRTGLAIHGSSVSEAKSAIEKWLKDNLR